MEYYSDTMNGESHDPVDIRYTHFMRGVIADPEAYLPSSAWRVKRPKDGTQILEISSRIRKKMLVVEIAMTDGSAWVTAGLRTNGHGASFYIGPTDPVVIEISRVFC